MNTRSQTWIICKRSKSCLMLCHLFCSSLWFLIIDFLSFIWTHDCPEYFFLKEFDCLFVSAIVWLNEKFYWMMLSKGLSLIVSCISTRVLHISTCVLHISTCVLHISTCILHLYMWSAYLYLCPASLHVSCISACALHLHLCLAPLHASVHVWCICTCALHLHMCPASLCVSCTLHMSCLSLYVHCISIHVLCISPCVVWGNGRPYYAVVLSPAADWTRCLLWAWRCFLYYHHQITAVCEMRHFT